MPAQRLFTNLYILARCTIRFSYPLIGTGDRYLMSQRDVLELLKWWARSDSNRRPNDYESFALTN